MIPRARTTKHRRAIAIANLYLKTNLANFRIVVNKSCVASKLCEQ